MTMNNFTSNTETWKEWLEEEWNKDYMKEILAKVNTVRKKTEVYPDHKDILKAFKCPIDKLKVVIIGQDPYYQRGVADGLAFSTMQDKRPVTLMIAFKEIANSIYDCNDPLCYSKLFPTNDLTYWVEQGVFLFNAALTVQGGYPSSHVELWKPFTMKVVERIMEIRKPIVWMLWGRKAQNIIPDEEQDLFSVYRNPTHLYISSCHPVAESRGTGTFLGTGVFKKTNDFLLKHYGEIIDWKTNKDNIDDAYHFTEIKNQAKDMPKLRK